MENTSYSKEKIVFIFGRLIDNFTGLGERFCIEVAPSMHKLPGMGKSVANLLKTDAHNGNGGTICRNLAYVKLKMWQEISLAYHRGENVKLP